MNKYEMCTLHKLETLPEKLRSRYGKMYRVLSILMSMHYIA